MDGFENTHFSFQVLDHPAFRASGIDSPTTPRGCGMIGASGQSSMEIDQITSLVSIFSFGQHIMAAQQRAASSSNSSSCTPLSSSITSISSPMLPTVASSCLSSSLSEPSIQLMSTKHEEKDDDNEEDESDHTSDHISRRVRRRANKKKSASIENAVPGEASDSESDTSSDSGHSSDDHDNSSEDKSSDTADDKSDEEISANESQNEENDEDPGCSDILISQIERKRALSTPSPVPDSFSCGSDNTKTVHADPCMQQVASV